MRAQAPTPMMLSVCFRLTDDQPALGFARMVGFPPEEVPSEGMFTNSTYSTSLSRVLCMNYQARRLTNCRDSFVLSSFSPSVGTCSYRVTNYSTVPPTNQTAEVPFAPGSCPPYLASERCTYHGIPSKTLSSLPFPSLPFLFFFFFVPFFFHDPQVFARFARNTLQR